MFTILLGMHRAARTNRIYWEKERENELVGQKTGKQYHWMRTIFIYVRRHECMYKVIVCLRILFHTHTHPLSLSSSAHSRWFSVLRCKTVIVMKTFQINMKSLCMCMRVYILCIIRLLDTWYIFYHRYFMCVLACVRARVRAFRWFIDVEHEYWISLTERDFGEYFQMIFPFSYLLCSVRLLYLAFEQPPSLRDFGTYEINDGMAFPITFFPKHITQHII